MQFSLIDLNRQTYVDLPSMLQLSFQPNQQCANLKLTQITYQFNKPINFYILRDYILQDIKLKRIQNQFNIQAQHIIPIGEDFYLENQELIHNLFELFLSFLYVGKIQYKNRDYFLPLLKLAIYFQCEALINSLLNQEKPVVMRSFFLNFLCDIYNDQAHLQTFKQTQNSEKFLQYLIQENSPNIKIHIDWHNHRKKDAQDKIKKAFAQVNPKLFEEFAIVYATKSPEDISYFTQLLFYIEQYENPQVQLLEDIYIGRIFELVDEEFFSTYQDYFTNRCKVKLEQIINKIRNPPYHMEHSLVCDLFNRSFKAGCNHEICLNCLFQYMIHRQKYVTENQKVPQKIRCLSRFLNKDICDYVFQNEDYLQLKEFQIDDLLNKYLQKKD
ncbi:unnamed protein product (macronuclear) [Paramecium tetraurelia]|uniref:BTB domain-containing protein n=1 Tax=Paramecium tetraurelia TaxID=5888 RepID=A0EB16_PARTE|nr:uncharacterized protein GSPATT00025217001 [Paramecium tetraurelia]CAK92483.1 unnamed protein product [Paramecium tetraurelia]|eukprot:XP_001459880.1 hypothetical protein (macronuclear) [Paramecium tetraurelia strain d4-2]